MTTKITILGQSNAVGFGMNASTVPTFLAGPMSGVTINGATLEAGVNTGTPNNPQAWGAEVMFAKLWTLDNPGQTLDIVKSAKGSTFLATDPNGLDWNPANANELYDTAITAIGTGPLDAILWLQGEQDATTSATASAYQANLTNLFANFRGDLGTGVPIIFNAIDPSGAAFPYSGTVRAAQAAVDAADANAWRTSSDGITLQTDGIHYDANGHVTNGGQLYAAFNTVAKSTTGTAADDLIGGSRAVDSLFGGDGNDLIFGGPGDDVTHGNQGNDTNHGGAGEDWVYGGKGDDMLFGDEDHDLVYGDSGNDTVNGGDGLDWVRGGAENDSLIGGAGDDFLSGDKGNDTISGGSGADTFNFFVGAGPDRVVDFVYAEGDKVRIEGGATYAVSYSGADTVVTLSSGDAMTLVGVHLTGSDWIVMA